MIRPALLILVPALAFPVMSYLTIAGDSTASAALAAAEAAVPPVLDAPTFDRREEGAYAAILERPLFSPSRRPVGAASSPSATSSPSGLALLGVVAGAGRAIALIRTGEGAPATKVEAGQEVAGWQVTALASTQVVLERQGNRLQLELPFKAAAPAPAPALDVAPEPITEAEPQPAPEPELGEAQTEG